MAKGECTLILAGYEGMTSVRSPLAERRYIRSLSGRREHAYSGGMVDIVRHVDSTSRVGLRAWLYVRDEQTANEAAHLDSSLSCGVA